MEMFDRLAEALVNVFAWFTLIYNQRYFFLHCRVPLKKIDHIFTYLFVFLFIYYLHIW